MTTPFSCEAEIEERKAWESPDQTLIYGVQKNEHAGEVYHCDVAVVKQSTETGEGQNRTEQQQRGKRNNKKKKREEKKQRIPMETE